MKRKWLAVIGIWWAFIGAVAWADHNTADIVWMLLWAALAIPISVRILIGFVRRLGKPDDPVHAPAWPRWLTRFILDDYGNGRGTPEGGGS